jgi:haloalkane dehalogenase
MKVLRTPEERFQSLPDFDFEPHYADIDGLRIHYLDEGPRDADPVLLLHGEPSWCYLYRHMIPPLVDARHRVVAPDLVGFGRSDKPADIGDYSYARHVAWMCALLEQLDLVNITLFCQDWGSLIGLRLAAEHPDRFARVMLSNGGLPDGDMRVPGVFRAWVAFARYSPWFPVGRIVDAGCVKDLSEAERRAYDAPFPSARYKAGARAFPRLVPVRPDDEAVPANRAAWNVFKTWHKPFLTAFGSRDPITRGADKKFQQVIPGAKDQPHTILHKAGHFIQEDKGPELAGLIDDWSRRSTRG